ncbi:uncharacterized protein LOC126742867 isoform X5 [Anthonomus grandis grandis]|uniref:uncharacterized protein LOC126742867 isoform X5 n=1 Tax=Anthonomus grandis grandis TaxID=2921223 RepID=UPI00216687A8|nr:uncharacterized protein LOC126742867 isoform X5 [Anthonomus grandis grandis]
MNEPTMNVPMDNEGSVILMFSLIVTGAFFSLVCLCWCKCRRNRNQPAQSDQNNIYNISGSVQGQNQHAYPDAYLSIDHIAITNELNKPPPKYDDAPPSYEEALKLAMAHSNSLQTYQSEQGHSADLPRTHLPAGSSID